MNDFRLELRDGAALEALETCKIDGDTLLFSDRGQPPIELWCVPGAETRRLVAKGSLQEEETSRTFTIPRQPGFPPPNEPSTGAKLTYEGKIWSISLEDGQGWKRDSVGACYVCTALRHQARRANPS